MGMIVILILTTKQVILQVTHRSLNRICFRKCFMGHWYVINEPEVADPQERICSSEDVLTVSLTTEHLNPHGKSF